MLSRSPFSAPIVAAILTTIAVASAIPAGAAITRTGTYLLVGSGGSGELHPDAAFDNKHNVYLAVWGDGGTGKDRPAWAQLVSAGGAMIGTKLRLTGCAAGVEVYGQKPAVTYTSGSTDNAFIVTYREWCGGEGNAVCTAAEVQLVRPGLHRPHGDSQRGESRGRLL